MANTGLDAVNFEADDVLRPQRRRKIAELVATLTEFRSTKIAVEVAPAEEGELRIRYDRYMAGTYEPGRSETAQIEFRLAQRLGHTYLLHSPSFGRAVRARVPLVRHLLEIRRRITSVDFLTGHPRRYGAHTPPDKLHQFSPTGTTADGSRDERHVISTIIWPCYLLEALGKETCNFREVCIQEPTKALGGSTQGEVYR